MTHKYVQVQENDAYKLKAVVALLENHATYKNLSLQQLEGLSEVIRFVKELPKRFEAAESPAKSTPTLEELKDDAKALGYTVVKEA